MITSMNRGFQNLKALEDATVTAVDALGDRIAAEEMGRHRAIDEERTRRLRLAEEQRAYVDARDRELREHCQARWNDTVEARKQMGDRLVAFQGRGFWSRFKWLLTGR